MALLGTSGISDSTQGALISLRPKIVLRASSCGTSWGDAIIYFSSLAYPANRATNRVDRVLFRCESTAWSEPVPTRIASATIQITEQGQMFWIAAERGR